MLPLPLNDEDDCLEAIDCGYHDEGNQGKLAGAGCNAVDQVAEIDACCREDEGSE